MTGWRLVADVGGTNVRFARAFRDGRLADRVERAVSEFPAFASALGRYLDQTGDLTGCEGARIAGAGPVADDAIRLTNIDWTIRAGEVSRVLRGAPVALFNDVQAAAMSVPHLSAEDLLPVVNGTGNPDPSAPRLAVNIGTGFGAATLAHTEPGWISVPSEAGHMTLAATSAEEFALCTDPGRRFRSVEDVLSGPGLVSLHRHLTAPTGAQAAPAPRPRQILAQRDTDPVARRAAEMFTALLARICGDLVLATAAWGGLYLFGSVVLGWHDHRACEAFRSIFTAKQKMASRMAAVPVHVVGNDLAPLIGLARH